MCDLYVCGAPCPPWSAAGRKNGLGDSRSHILFHCLKYICITRPGTIVIENVKGITSRNFSHVLNFIEKLLKNCKYNFHHTVLDTKQHGIPQSRPRWYLVGIHHTCDEKTFEWPEEIERPSLDQFLDAEVQSPDVSLTALTPRNQKILKDLMRKKFKGLELSEACPVLDILARFQHPGEETTAKPWPHFGQTSEVRHFLLSFLPFPNHRRCAFIKNLRPAKTCPLPGTRHSKMQQEIMRRVVAGHTAADRARVSPEERRQIGSVAVGSRRVRRGLCSSGLGKQNGSKKRGQTTETRTATTAFAAHQIPLLQKNTAPDARKAKKHFSDKHASLFVLPKLPDQMFTTRAGKKKDAHARKNKGGKACGFDEFGTPQAEDVFFVPALPDRADLQMTDRVRK